jgi:hypothetical protein
MSTDSHDKDHDHDRSYENESTRDHTPMVQITLREYDKLKEKPRKTCKIIKKTHCKDRSIMDDRGPNDLEKIIDEQNKTITHLKHDNKTLAKEVSDLIEEKKKMLDNKS